MKVNNAICIQTAKLVASSKMKEVTEIPIITIPDSPPPSSDNSDDAELVSIITEPLISSNSPSVNLLTPAGTKIILIVNLSNAE